MKPFTTHGPSELALCHAAVHPEDAVPPREAAVLRRRGWLHNDGDLTYAGWLRVEELTGEPILTEAEKKVSRTTVWRSLFGCDCPRLGSAFSSGGVVQRDDVCTVNAVRCNGRMKVIFREYRKRGWTPGPGGKAIDAARAASLKEERARAQEKRA